jgi:hypothetical protein
MNVDQDCHRVTPQFTVAPAVSAGSSRTNRRSCFVVTHEALIEGRWQPLPTEPLNESIRVLRPGEAERHEVAVIAAPAVAAGKLEGPCLVRALERAR